MVSTYFSYCNLGVELPSPTTPPLTAEQRGDILIARKYREAVDAIRGLLDSA
jgi:hypothetical protein